MSYGCGYFDFVKFLFVVLVVVVVVVVVMDGSTAGRRSLVVFRYVPFHR